MLERVGRWLTEMARADLLPPGPPVRPYETLARPTTVEDVIGAAISARQSGFALADALRMPPVIRGKSLIRSMGAQLPVTLYRGGVPAPEQPRIVRQPTAYKSRGEFVGESIDSLMDHGCAFWLLGDYDSDNRAQFATVIPHDEVAIDWQPGFRGLIPRYKWHERELVADRDIKHVAINRRPGELHGRGPLTEGLEYLGAVAAAERFAASWFLTGGVPSVTLRTKVELDEQKSLDLKAKWMAAHADGLPTPAVLGGGIEDHYPDTNPASSQLQEARAFGSRVVAILLGIPAPLMIVETSGSTIVYQNGTAALGDLVKGTLAPVYLSPIEQAWSDLVGGRASVRFELGELQRADISARVNVYRDLLPLGVVDAAQVRTWEGWGPVGATIENPALAPLPAPREIPASVEVPAI